MTKKELLAEIESLEETVTDNRFTDTHIISSTKISLKKIRDALRADLDPLKEYR